MVDNNYLEQLNNAQRAAVEYTGGAELVIAGAGSGKTRVLTYKIIHLLKQGLNPHNILALTFTNKAAEEMRQRIAALADENVAKFLWMGTFHSIFARILRYNAERIGFNSNFTIYDAVDSKNLVKTIIKELNLDEKVYKPGHVAADISNAKNNLLSPEDYLADASIQKGDSYTGRPRTGEIFKIYAERCRVAGAMDFDDLLYFTNVLFRDNPDVLQRYQTQFKYILVDEYQDTNCAQHLIVMQLAGKQKNVCVVGDDAQSIYSFRGANIKNILNLNRSFPDLKIFKLEENYRSTGNITGAANSLIAANEHQYYKNVHSCRENGERLELVQCYSAMEEAETIVSRIMQLRRKASLPLNEIAILYRTNVQSRLFEETLRNRNIPYRVYGGLAFYQRKEIKDAVSYFRLAINPHDDEALVRVINTPKRGIGETTIKKLRTAAIDNGTSIYEILSNASKYSLNVNRGTLSKLEGFLKIINNHYVLAQKGSDAATLAEHIMDSTKLIHDYLDSSTPENVTKRENVLELIAAVKSFTNNALETDEPCTMADFLARVSLLSDQDTATADGQAVTLMTIHSAKGLEFGAVFVVGVEESILPSDKSLRSAEAIEEERRLMYVAITRAKSFCMLSYCRFRMRNGQIENAFQSRFIADIEPRYLRLLNGAKLPKRSSESTKDINSSSPAPMMHTTQPLLPRTFKPIGAQSTAVSSKSSTNDGFNVHRANELETGMTIVHKNFGRGTIVSIDTTMSDAKIVVQFSSTDPKTLLLKYARFQIL